MTTRMLLTIMMMAVMVVISTKRQKISKIQNRQGRPETLNLSTQNPQRYTRSAPCAAEEDKLRSRHSQSLRLGCLNDLIRSTDVHDIRGLGLSV